MFDKTDLTPEIGAVRGFYLARARDPRIREKAQHGGSVTALLHLALKEGLIREAVLTGAGEDLLPREVRISDPEEVTGLSKSRFVVSPVLGLFNRLAADGPGKIGIVATPCQALALAKMRAKTDKSKPTPTDRLNLVIGLFCGWALSCQKLRQLLQEKVGTSPVLGMDIPPSRYHSLDVYTETGDRIATHILAFEGDSKVVWFEGNYSEYEADRKKRLGKEADQPHMIRYRKLTRNQ